MAVWRYGGMAVCRWRRDNSQRANLGQGKAIDITSAQAACQPGRGAGVRARWAGPGQGQALAGGAGGTERQVEPLRSGRNGHGQSLCHGEARKAKLPTYERCATSSSGQGSGRRKTPSMPRFFPHGFMPAVFPASRPVQVVGVALMGDRSPLGKRSGAVAYQAGPVAGMAP